MGRSHSPVRVMSSTVSFIGTDEGWVDGSWRCPLRLTVVVEWQQRRAKSESEPAWALALALALALRCDRKGEERKGKGTAGDSETHNLAHSLTSPSGNNHTHTYTRILHTTPCQHPPHG